MKKPAKKPVVKAETPVGKQAEPQLNGRKNVSILDGKAKISEAGIRGVSIHRPNGELLEHAANEADAVARAEALIAKGAL